MEATFKGGQDSYRIVELMMMMMMWLSNQLMYCKCKILSQTSECIQLPGQRRATAVLCLSLDALTNMHGAPKYVRINYE
jgi:hypothetical protein